MTWMNSDGLLVKFGTEKTVLAKGGSFEYEGPNRMIELEVNIANLTTTTTAVVVGGDSVIFPRNSFIESVEIMTTATAATITSLSFGLIRLDRTTELDYDGFIAALALASFNSAGETVKMQVGSTSVGALVGTTLAYPGLPVAYIAGTVGTGTIKLRVRFSVIGEDANPTNF